METLDNALGGFKLWRWMRAGVWERWRLDAPGDPVRWFRRERLTRERGSRPTAQCRGTVLDIEDYRQARRA